MNNLVIAIIILVAICLLAFMSDKKEAIGTGALIQLQAKGPQDTYLTGDAWKYFPPWYYNSFWGPYGPFYIPTRNLKYYPYYPYYLY